MEALLQLQKISKRFPGVKALDQVDLNVYPGKVMALMGENGAGKSTLMKVLTGIYAKDAGDIIYQGHSVEFKNPRQSQLAGISIIHQELNLIPELSIAENIFLGREFVTSSKRIMWTEMYAQADQLLQRLGVKYSSKEKLGHLSLGVQQMVEIAKALSLNAQVLIMDEPTDALTDAETQILFRVIRELRAEGRGIVYISHRLNEIFEICDQVTVLRDGQWIAQSDITAINEQQLIEMMVGRPLDDRYPYLQTTVGDVRLEVKNLEGHGVKDVSFVLRSAEILGVSGLMGSGRTELMKLLFGVNPITQGALYVQGALFSPSSPKEALRKGIAYISEDRKGEGLIIGLSVKANMTLGSLAYFTQGFQLQHQQETRAVKQFIQSFSIKTPSENQIVGLLSGGNQQKVSLAKGLMTRPKVLILDEPTRGVDVGAKREIYQLINEFKAQGGSIILVSSDMPEVLGMSDRILVMHAGVIVGEFDRQEATQEKLLSCAVAQL